MLLQRKCFYDSATKASKVSLYFLKRFLKSHSSQETRASSTRVLKKQEQAAQEFSRNKSKQQKSSQETRASSTRVLNKQEQAAQEFPTNKSKQHKSSQQTRASSTRVPKKQEQEAQFRVRPVE